MGYFPNGESGLDYQEHYCSRCVHDQPEFPSCPCWMAHLFWNSDEVGKPDSLLHKMIPKNDRGNNEQCLFFHEKLRKDRP